APGGAQDRGQGACVCLERDAVEDRALAERLANAVDRDGVRVRHDAPPAIRSNQRPRSSAGTVATRSRARAYGAAAPYEKSFVNAQNPVASVLTAFGCRMSVAVSSVEELMKTRENPAASAGARIGSVTRKSTLVRPWPRERATSSMPGGTWATPARTAT